MRMVNHPARLTDTVNIPILIDEDTGHGRPLLLRRHDLEEGGYGLEGEVEQQI